MLAFVSVGVTPVVVGNRVFWVKSNRFSKVGDGLVVLALLEVREAPVVVGFGVFRVEPNVKETSKRPHLLTTS